MRVWIIWYVLGGEETGTRNGEKDTLRDSTNMSGNKENERGR
jgi:hypothetical protein